MPEIFDERATRTLATPIPTAKTTRMQDVRALTSLPAGRVVPILAVPLLRMDAVRRMELRFSFEMMETVQVLMNAVTVDVKAYLVTNLALDRFDGPDALNRSYSGIAVEGLAVVPFVETQVATAPGVNLIHKYLGNHYKTGESINTIYDEAYNQIWNFRARNRSPELSMRTRLQADLAPAFWKHQQFRNVVPQFDQAIIDGEVPLNITNSNVAIKGIGIVDGAGVSATPANTRMTSGAMMGGNSTNTNITQTRVQVQNATATTGATNLAQIFADMASAGITVSLSNLELARKTQAFALLKEQYQGITDEYIIDLLMSGIEVPEQAMNQPMLLAQNSTIFGMSKRYATDAANLTDSVVNGATFMDLTVRTPPIPYGGVIMVTAEILPEQLFERQRDPMMFVGGIAGFPDYLRDTLDPEKVEIVQNAQIDAAHATPTGTFGYAPLNHKWMMQQVKIGGRFYRPDPASVTNDEDRQRIWAVETVNPTLAADFYISTNINTKPFVVTNQDPFEVVTRGMAMIEGNTVFGDKLIESTGSYDEVMAKADQTRLPTNS